MGDRKFVIQGEDGTAQGPADSPFMQFLAKNHPEAEVPVDMDMGTVDFLLRKLKERIDIYEGVLGASKGTDAMADQWRGLVDAWNLIHSLKSMEPYGLPADIDAIVNPT